MDTLSCERAADRFLRDTEIPTQPNGGNHTPEFAASARSLEAHKTCMKMTKGLAWTGFLVLTHDEFHAAEVLIHADGRNLLDR